MHPAVEYINLWSIRETGFSYCKVITNTTVKINVTRYTLCLLDTGLFLSILSGFNTILLAPETPAEAED